MREGIRDFLDMCSIAGRSRKSAHFLYVNGMDHCGNKIHPQEHLQRGACLESLTKMWLYTWGQEEEFQFNCDLQFPPRLCNDCPTLQFFLSLLTRRFIAELNSLIPYISEILPCEGLPMSFDLIHPQVSQSRRAHQFFFSLIVLSFANYLSVFW